MELLDSVSEAFNRMDLEGVMAHFAKDALFDHGAGPEVYGTRFSGKEAIGAAFRGLFEKVVSVHWETLDARICGNKAFCEYHRVAKFKDGSVQDFNSLDVLTYRGGLIVRKDTYYKHRT